MQASASTWHGDISSSFRYLTFTSAASSSRLSFSAYFHLMSLPGIPRLLHAPAEHVDMLPTARVATSRRCKKPSWLAATQGPFPRSGTGHYSSWSALMSSRQRSLPPEVTQVLASSRTTLYRHRVKGAMATGIQEMRASGTDKYRAISSTGLVHHHYSNGTHSHICAYIVIRD